MKLFDSELQYQAELYHRLRSEFETLDHSSQRDDAASLMDAISRNRELLSRIEQMDTRLFQLAQEWQKFRRHIDPVSKSHTQKLAEAVREQATQLLKISEQRIQKLEERRSSLERDLAEVQKGARYLESVKPIKANFPKFVDSVG